MKTPITFREQLCDLNLGLDEALLDQAEEIIKQPETLIVRSLNGQPFYHQGHIILRIPT